MEFKSSILDKIKNYYYCQTLEGQRVVALNLTNDIIYLTPDFPYYSEGIRVIKHGFDHYYEYDDVYVDLSIIDSSILSALSVGRVIFISNDYNLKDRIVSFNLNYSFEIDMSENIIGMSSCSNYTNGYSMFSILCLENFINSNARVRLCSNKAKVVDTSENISTSFRILELLSNVHFISGNKKNVKVCLDIELFGSYEFCLSNMDLIKLIMKDYCINSKHVCLEFSLNLIGMKYDDYTVLNSQILNCQESIDYPDFKFLRPYKKYFKNIRVRLLWLK